MRQLIIGLFLIIGINNSFADVSAYGINVAKTKLDHLNVSGTNLVKCVIQVTGFESDGSTETVVQYLKYPAQNAPFAFAEETLRITSYARYTICCGRNDVDFYSSAVQKDGTVIDGHSEGAHGCTMVFFTLE